MTVLVVDLAVMIVYTIRRGQSDDLPVQVITENRPLSSMSLSYPPLMGWSTRKMLGSKSEFITMELLVDGTATLQADSRRPMNWPVCTMSSILLSDQAGGDANVA